MKKFNEIYEEMGVSRSTVQGWINKFFDTKQLQKDSTGWKFTDEEVAKIWEIYFYKELDYKGKDIERFLECTQEELNEMLSVKINDLVKEKERIERLIFMSEFIRHSGFNPTSFQYVMSDYGGIKYKTINESICEMVSVNFGFFEMEEFSQRLKFIDTEYVLKCIDTIMLKRCMNVDYYESEITEYIRKIHEAMHCFIGKSVLIFMGAGIFFSPGNIYSSKIDKKYGPQSSEYLFSALKCYVEKNIDNDFDRTYFDIVENIIKLSEDGYVAESNEVQAQVRKIFDFYNSCLPLSGTQNNMLFKIICDFLNDIDLSEINSKKEYEGGNFIIQAMKFFCKAE